jgi:S1-C subfamily serine protease
MTWWLLLALCLGATVSTTYASGLVETIAKLKPSIVGISSLQPTQLTPAVLVGSGFAVADGNHIVTSYHVVRQNEAAAGKVFYVMSVNGAQTDRRNARVVAADPATDLALLQIDGPALPPLKLREEVSMAPEGTEIAITGFPIGIVLGFQPTTTRGIVSALPSNLTPEVHAGGLTADNIRAPRFSLYQLDVIAYPGNSGGPVYDTSTGEVIGVVAAGFIKSRKEKVLSDPSAITYAIPSALVRNLLIRAHLKN